MEVPALEDSMEMASPYQGQADDFDIDIDLMEDHPSNMDSDMVGADDFPNTSQPSLFNDAINDADMADEEPSEGSMVDADNFVDEDHDIEVQDDAVTYEADMLEGDQDEEIVEAVPTIQIEDAASNNDVTHHTDQNITDQAERIIGLTPQAQELQPPSAPPTNEAEVLQHDQELQPQLTLDQPEQHDQGTSLEPEPKPAEQDQADKPNEPHGTAAAASVDIDQASLDEGANATTEDKAVTAETQPGHQETSITEDTETKQAVEVQSSFAPAIDNNSEHPEHQDVDESHGESHEDQLHSSSENESLHPVKVLYQDNEISLFPPLEGDSAETFFLHDEDVAYDSVGKLFSSLREVLLDNVADDEVLVIDIDSLGIQLTEDSTHNSKMTLHHILEIYTRLSQNDGTSEPDALYLTLGSKISAHSELAGLDSAAHEGKGLSQIHAWDVDYEDAGHEDVPVHEEDSSAGDSFAGKPQTEKPLEVDEIGQNEADAQESAAPAEAHKDFVPNNQETDAALAENEHHLEQEKNATAEETHDTEANDSHHGDKTKEHDSFEDPKTESSATISLLPESTAQLADASVDVNEAAPEHAEQKYQADDDKSGQDLNHKTSALQGADEHEQDQNPEESQDEVSYEETEAPGTVVDTDAIDLTCTHDEGLVDAPNARTENQEATADEGDDHESLGESDSTVDNAPQEEGAGFEEHDLDPEDDLLGIAEDVLQTTQGDYDDHLENSEDDLTTPPGEEVDGHEPHTGEDEEDDLYADFETSETIELGETDHSLADSQPHDNTSTKRSREDDEWDFADADPELKRRRPS
ncbi:hypothetical protein N7481_005382 [Penicillium waksmanii]|uniref:uncharacterized protein n=1 Tax=Penicillium waksmanii TaxID=69791 RepID=UPI0025496D3F|nr:uncharacterized protein N7481_005382 [Penicillium waksmanii]KAJ5983283.1 hypothetical protein N7481_005382 [Penicillium waksmanii]